MHSFDVIDWLTLGCIAIMIMIWCWLLYEIWHYRRERFRFNRQIPLSYEVQRRLWHMAQVKVDQEFAVSRPKLTRPLH